MFYFAWTFFIFISIILLGLRFPKYDISFVNKTKLEIFTRLQTQNKSKTKLLPFFLCSFLMLSLNGFFFCYNYIICTHCCQYVKKNSICIHISVMICSIIDGIIYAHTIFFKYIYSNRFDSYARDFFVRFFFVLFLVRYLWCANRSKWKKMRARSHNKYSIMQSKMMMLTLQLHDMIWLGFWRVLVLTIMLL